MYRIDATGYILRMAGNGGGLKKNEPFAKHIGSRLLDAGLGRGLGAGPNGRLVG
jgi:hypothetical protein